MAPITTPLTQLLGIEHPILLAGMGMTSTATLAAAVSNAGGVGVIGGVGYTPAQLRAMITELKALLIRPDLPFGVDLLLPQVGGANARKTNYDYTKGALDELIDAVIDGGAKLFVSAVGVPPKRVVDKLHAHGVLYMNMVGHPRHVAKACDAGADLICAQGGEAGGHTGDVPFSVLVPACADLCAKRVAPLTGRAVGLVAAGGVSDGRSLAAALMLGAQAVWVGTRFVAARESGASEHAKREVLRAGFDDVIRSTVWTGRPLRARKTQYILDWEVNRQSEIRDLTARGVLPVDWDLDRLQSQGKLTDEIMEQAELQPMGIVAGLVNKPDQTAKEIVDEIVTQAAELLGSAGNYVNPQSKL